MLQLEVVSGVQKGTVFTIEEESCNIGRGLANEVILYDEKISSRHAAIVRSAGRLLVRDLNSTNGTFLNGLPVDAAVVKNGDKLRLGDTELVIRFSEQRPDTDTAVVRLVGDGAGSGPVIRETVRSSEGSTIFDVDLGKVKLDTLLAAHRNLKAIYRVNSIFNTTFDLGVLFEKIMDQIFEVTRASRPNPLGPPA